MVVRLKRRPEFLATAASGRRWVMPAFVLQAGPRPPGDPDPTIGLGFTASRKVGQAVVRNRAKRRLRAAAAALLPSAGQAGYNYVLIARSAVVTCPFDHLLNDLRIAFTRVTRERPAKAPKGTAAGVGRSA